PDRQVLIAFLFFVLSAGGASIAIRVTYGEMAPFWSATARFGLAAIAFWILVLIKRLPLPRGRALLGAIIFGVLTVGLAFILIGWGLVATPASTYQVLMALVPLFTLFLSALQGLESIHKKGLIGSLLAVVGIAVTVGGGSATGLSLPHIAAILLAAVCIAEGGVLIKKFPPNPPIMTNAIGMSAGTIILAAASLLAGETWNIPTQTDTWIAFTYLVVIVTVVTFLLYMFVLSKWTASGTSYGFVLIPLVTMVLAATLVGEQITINFLVGAALVLSGVFIGALLPSRTHSEAVEECKDRAGQTLPRCT
ncbi:MAG: DMT family transporter, partial [Candidatus Promineifilaceae bacterium]